MVLRTTTLMTYICDQEEIDIEKIKEVSDGENIERIDEDWERDLNTRLKRVDSSLLNKSLEYVKALSDKFGGGGEDIASLYMGVKSIANELLRKY